MRDLLTPGRGYFPMGVRCRAGPWFGYKTRDSAMRKEPGADTQSFAAAEKPRADRSDRQVKNCCDFFASHALQSDQQNNSTLLIGELGDTTFEIAQLETRRLIGRDCQIRVMFL